MTDIGYAFASDTATVAVVCRRSKTQASCRQQTRCTAARMQQNRNLVSNNVYSTHILGIFEKLGEALWGVLWERYPLSIQLGDGKRRKLPQRAIGGVQAKKWI